MPKIHKTFHANGELAEECQFDKAGRVVYDAWYKTQGKTREKLPYWLVAPASAWKIIKTANPPGKPYGWTIRYWDKRGVEIDDRGKPLKRQGKGKAECKAFLKKPKGESAAQAVDRYE